jgi:hypothetical protein
MILVFKKPGDCDAQLIPNVKDLRFVGNNIVWKIGSRENQFEEGIDLDVFEREYQFAYAMCNWADSKKMGVDGELKWLIWNHYLIADLTSSEALKYMKENPI